MATRAVRFDVSHTPAAGMRRTCAVERERWREVPDGLAAPFRLAPVPHVTTGRVSTMSDSPLAPHMRR